MASERYQICTITQFARFVRKLTAQFANLEFILQLCFYGKRIWQSVKVYLISLTRASVDSHTSQHSGASTDHPEEVAGDSAVGWSLPIGLTNATAHQVRKDIKIPYLQDHTLCSHPISSTITL